MTTMKAGPLFIGGMFLANTFAFFGILVLVVDGDAFDLGAVVGSICWGAIMTWICVRMYARDPSNPRGPQR